MVNNVSYASSAGMTTQTERGGFEAYGGAEFMQMLMAQMTHQNPLEPMNDSEMMSQYAQLNSLQQLQDIKTAISQSAATNQIGYAAGLIGKTITAQGSDGIEISGIVKAVTVESGDIKLQLDDKIVDLADVKEIKGA